MRSMRKILILKYIKAKERQARYKQVRVFLYNHALINSQDAAKNASNLAAVSSELKLYKRLIKCLFSK